MNGHTLTVSADEEVENDRRTDPVGLTIDDATEVLSAERRRRAVEFLNERREAEFAEVAEFVAEEEFGPGYSNDERKRVYVALYQSHMDTLDKYGVVEFDGTGNPVRQGPEFEKAVRYLRALQRVENDEDAGRFHSLRDLLGD